MRPDTAMGYNPTVTGRASEDARVVCDSSVGILHLRDPLLWINVPLRATYHGHRSKKNDDGRVDNAGAPRGEWLSADQSSTQCPSRSQTPFIDPCPHG